MPLRPARVGRVGVIRTPVAKTAVVAAAVTPRVGRRRIYVDPPEQREARIGLTQRRG